MMNCSEFSRELRERMRKSWDAASIPMTAEMTDHASDCDRCRAQLAAARALHGPDPGALEAPEGLVKRTLERVRVRDQRPDAAPRRRVIPLLAAAAALVVMTATVTVLIARRADPDTVLVHLTLEAPGARSVAVVGDWNNWNLAAQPLADPDGDGVWELRIRVEPSREYEYQFVIDTDRWMSDPAAVLQVDDGFGGTNSVLDI